VGTRYLKQGKEVMLIQLELVFLFWTLVFEFHLSLNQLELGDLLDIQFVSSYNQTQARIKYSLVF
jgi:hypothetical protein